MKRLLKYYILFGILLSACTHHYYNSKVGYSHQELKQLKEDSLSKVFISTYKNKLDSQMNEVIAVCDSALTKDGTESTLANFILNAMDHFTEVNKPELKNKTIAIVNRGGLRINLPKGKISVGTIYELMPFDNEMVFLSLNGKQVKAALNSFCENGKLFTNHVNYLIVENKPLNIKIYNDTLNEQATYIIATTDYLSHGGDNSTFFLNPVKTEITGVKLRDVIIDYCRYLTQHNQHIFPYKDGRISVSK